MIKDLNLQSDDVPFLFGELVNADQNGACESMKTMIDELPKTIPNSHIFSPQGCIGCPGHLHFKPAGYRVRVEDAFNTGL